MHVGLNLLFLVPGETGGMEVYARELIPALRDADPGLRLTAFVSREAAGEDFGVDSRVLPIRATRRVEWVSGEQLVLPQAARRAAVDVLHSLGNTAPAHGRYRRIVTIHDLHYRTAPDAHFGLRRLGMRLLVPLAARTADRIVTVSKHSGSQIVELLGVPANRVDVVPNGLGRVPSVAPTPESVLRDALDLGRRRVVLALSAKRPHKNLRGLLDALALIGPERRPVAVLPGYRTPHEADLRAHALRLGIADDVRFMGWVGDADVEGLLRLAAAFVMPSFSEGFGLPVLEAMARGVPVACSGTGALGEVAGDAAVTFDPADPREIAAAIERLLSDPATFIARGKARAAEFTWRRTAELTRQSYDRALRSA